MVGQVVTWVVTITVIRLLSPEDYGLMAMAGVFMGFFFLISELGFGSAGIQAPNLDEGQLERVLGVILLTHGVGCLVLVMGAPLLASLFAEPRLTPLIRALALTFFLIAAYALPAMQVARELDFPTKAKLDLVASTLGAGASLGMAVGGLGVWALVGGQLVMHAALAVGYNWVRPLRLRPRFSVGEIRTILEFGVTVTVARILFFFYSQADIVIGGRVLGSEAIGIYSVALSLAATPMEKLLPIITTISFAAFSRIQMDEGRVRRNLLRSVQVVSLTCFPAFLGMAAVAGDLVPILLGPTWADLVVPFQLLCLVIPLKALSALPPPAVLGVGRARVEATNMAVSLAGMVLALMIGVRYGVVGICLAWIAAYPLIFIVINTRSLAVVGLKLGTFLSEARFAAVASAFMAAIVLLTRELLEPMGVSFSRLTILVLVGAATYGSLVLGFQRETVKELVRLARS